MTPREDQAFRFIAKHQEERGYPPTLAEIAAHMGLRSKCSVARVLAQLKRAGYLAQVPRRRRGYEVTKQPAVVGTCPACGRGDHVPGP